jgi:hypothetical protein
MTSLCSPHRGYRLRGRRQAARVRPARGRHATARGIGETRCPSGLHTSTRAVWTRPRRSERSDIPGGRSSSRDDRGRHAHGDPSVSDRVTDAELRQFIGSCGRSSAAASPSCPRTRSSSPGSAERHHRGNRMRRLRAPTQTRSRSLAGARAAKRGAASVTIMGRPAGVPPCVAAWPRLARSAPARLPGIGTDIAKFTLSAALPLDADGNCRSNGPRFARAQAYTLRSVTPADRVGFKEMDVLNSLLKRGPRGRTGGAAGVSLIAQLMSGFGV